MESGWSTRRSGRTSFASHPTDHGVAFRLAEYLIPKGLKVALLHDDSGYGQQGADALDQAFGSNPESVATRLAAPLGGDGSRAAAPRGEALRGDGRPGLGAGGP